MWSSAIDSYVGMRMMGGSNGWGKTSAMGSISATIVEVIAFERLVGLAFKRQYGRVSND
jgi:hypothetical protein